MGSVIMSWLPKKVVVVPVDFSEESFEALDTALANFVDDASGLRIVYVLPALVPAEPGVIWDTVDDHSRVTHAKQAFAERLSDPKWKGIGIDVVVGDAGREIADFAHEVGAELVVLPSHGRTGITRLLIGSTAERVVRLCHCPVLVLRN